MGCDGAVGEGVAAPAGAEFYYNVKPVAFAPGWFGEGVWGERVGALRARERAVILTAVQSLRLLVRRGLGWERGG